MARIWDFSVSFEPKMVANAMARFWKLDGWKFTTLLDAKGSPVDHCPISLEPMEDPVLAHDGHIYDKNSITQWIQEGNKVSPCTREDLGHTKLLRIQPFCTAIEKFLRNHGELTEAEVAAAQVPGGLGANLELMKSCSELAAHIEQKLRKKDLRANTISAGRMACEALEEAIRANEAEILELQETLTSAQQRLKSLQTLLESEAAHIVQSFLLMKPMQDRSAMTIQRRWREHLRRKAWKDRSEKLARHCATAIAAGNEELVKRFQSKGDLDYQLVLKFLRSAEVNRLLPPGVTALHKAAMAGQTISARLLCKAGVDKDAVGPELTTTPSAPAELHEASRTALYAAAQGGHLGVVRILCEERAEVDKGALLTGASPLFTAAEYGHTEVVKVLCASSAAVNGSLFETGLIPLHAAAKNGHFEVVQYLCLCRGDVCKATSKPVVTQLISSEPDAQQRGDVLPEVGITPLFLAARGGHAEIVHFLCEAQAEVNRTLPESGCTTLHMACRKGHERVVQLLLAAKASANIPLTAVNKFTPLHAAASAGCELVVKQLCEARAYMDQPTGDIEATPLYLAAANGFLEVVKVLCKAKADVNKTPTMTSATPLYMACLNVHPGVVQSLCAARADLEKEVLPSRKPPLFIAACKGNAESVEALCKAGAQIAKLSGSGVGALHAAAMNSHGEVIETLVRNKANVNQKSSMDLTPLHLASLNGHDLLAKYLCYAGADKSLCAKKPGSTALMMAVLCGHANVVEALCDEHWGGMSQMLAASKLLLHVAARNGYEAIVWHLCAIRADVNERVTEICPEETPSSREEFAEDMDDETLCDQSFDSEYGVSTEDLNGSETEEIPGMCPVLGEEEVKKQLQLVVGATPLWVGAQAGHLSVVQMLVGAHARVDDAANGASPLLAATYQGHVMLVRFLLHSKAQADGGSSLVTPLYVSASRNNFQLVQILCDYSAEVNKVNPESDDFPLLVAAQKRSKEALKLLMKWRADTNQCSPHGTALSFATRLGHRDLVEALLEGRASLEPSRRPAPLELAVERIDAELVQMLLLARANPNEGLATAASGGLVEILGHLLMSRVDVNQDCEGYTPLMLAAMNGHIRVVQRLTKVKAKVNATTSKGEAAQMAALHLAIQSGHLDVVQALTVARADVNQYGGMTPLCCAVKKRDFQATKYLVQQKANLNLPGTDGMTPVLLACDGDQKSLEYLLRQRADANLADAEGRSPLHLAAGLEESVRLLELLLRAKADVNHRNKVGRTPLVAAMERNQVMAVKTLCEHRADTNIATERGATPLLLIAETSHVETLEMLLKHRADLERPNPDFRATPLHIAAFMGNAPMAKKLCDARARVDIATTRGHTPLHYAAWGGHIHTLHSLLVAQADTTICVYNRQGINAFFMAVVQGHQDVLRMLFNACRGGVHFCSALLHVAAKTGQERTVQTLCTMKCDVNEALDAESTQGMLESATTAHGPNPCDAQSSLIQLEEQVLEDEDEGEEDLQNPDDSQASCCSHRIDVELPPGAFPLFLAAAFGHRALVPVLLEAKASVNQSAKGNNAICAAAEAGHLEVLNLLLEKRAHLRHSDARGLSPLHLAAAGGHSHVVEELCRRRVELDGMAQGRTALHRACEGSVVAMIEALCRARANLDLAQEDGHTALTISAARGNLRIVEMLCRSRADSSLRCPDGTALELARARGHERIAQLLSA